MNILRSAVLLLALPACTNNAAVLPPHLYAQNCGGEFGSAAPPAAIPLRFDVQVTLQPTPETLVGFPLDHRVILDATSTDWLHYASTTAGCLDEWRGSVPSNWDHTDLVSPTLSDVWVPEDGNEPSITVGAFLDATAFPALNERLDEELQTLKLEVWMSVWHDSYFTLTGTVATSPNPALLDSGPAVMSVATP
jgi:hypothetical protein